MFPPLLSCLALAGVLMVFAVPSAQGGPKDTALVPHLDARGRDAYQQFLAAMPPRAFAIAPGGAWGWSADAVSPEAAEQEALATCQANTQQTCVVYARDREVVLDHARWAEGWGPYKKVAEARKASVGVKRGERFPNLAFADAKGRPIRLSELRGRVTVLHFWGSWCTPCRREMPDLAHLAEILRNDAAIRFVFLQVREDFSTSRAWAEKLWKGLPLYDSGMRKSGAAYLKLADGGQIKDREIAKVFPTTYVLDRHGIVVFAHVGTVFDWRQYADFLRDAADRSGK